MQKTRKRPRTPFEEDQGILSGARDGLSHKLRSAMNGLYDYGQRQREPTVIKVGSGFYQNDTEWMAEGVCVGTDDPEAFWPETDKDKLEERWRDYCEVCPVMMTCREFGSKNHLVGVWGNVFRPEKNRSSHPVGRPPVTGTASIRSKEHVEKMLSERSA